MTTEIRDGRLVRHPMADPVFLLQVRMSSILALAGEDTPTDRISRWHTVSAWYDQEEAERWAATHRDSKLAGRRYRVHTVHAKGELRDILRTEDAVRGARHG